MKTLYILAFGVLACFVSSPNFAMVTESTDSNTSLFEERSPN
ncbi:hypothetical protein N9N03_01950 [Chlamydiia bacterium]|nr:hypothetical protein [Chlamydiia bacterium]